MPKMAHAPARQHGQIPWRAMLRLALMLPLAAKAADTVRLRVMTLNIFYGGDEWNLATGDFWRRPQGCNGGVQSAASRDLNCL